MWAVQCRSSRLMLCQAIRGFIGDVRRRWDSRGCRFALAILLFAHLVTLLPLASADLPDPTWLVGIYDESDGDSVVWLIERTEVTKRRESVNDGRWDSDVRPHLCVIVALRYLSDSAPACISLLASPARAPPFEGCAGVPSSFAFHLLGARKPFSAVRRPVQLTRSAAPGRRIGVHPPLSTSSIRAPPPWKLLATASPDDSSSSLLAVSVSPAMANGEIVVPPHSGFLTTQEQTGPCPKVGQKKEHLT